MKVRLEEDKVGKKCEKVKPTETKGGGNVETELWRLVEGEKSSIKLKGIGN